MTRRDPSVDAPARDVDAVGEALAALAARLHAATYELLVLLRDFDARGGWNHGFASCAHWLHSTPTRRIRASGTPAGARESTSAPRARRCASPGPDSEAALLDLALAGTAAHVERAVRAWRRIDAVEAARQEEARHLSRSLATWVDDDGMVVIRGRLTPELGAVVMRALEAASDRLFRDAAAAPAAGGLAGEVSPAQRRADALGVIAEAALAAQLDGGTAGDRYQVAVHVEAGTAPARHAAAVTMATAAMGAWNDADHTDPPAALATGGTLELDAAPWTFPRKRHDGWPATRRWW
jgi:hypothetical protein